MFDVTSRDEPITGWNLLEASAGTGKTFAIEHLVLRLLLELEPATSIDRILVVTFTRAATRELKGRIRANLKRAIKALEEGDCSCPDYIKRFIEEGRRASALQRMREALIAFDEAPINTIHGFCHQMLCEHAPGLAYNGEAQEGLSQEQELSLASDLLAFRLKEIDLSLGQLKAALSLTRGDMTALAMRIIRESHRGKCEGGSLTFASSFEAFCRAMERLKVSLSEEGVLADLQLLMGCYKGMTSSSGELKAEVWSNTASFAALLSKESWSPQDFESLIREGLLLLHLLTPDNQKIKAKLPPTSSLAHPDLIALLKRELEPHLLAARDGRHILARLVQAYQALRCRVIKERELISFDDILEQMDAALTLPAFVEAVRGRFSAAICDEFQDTDGLQWSIFRTLFASHKNFPLFLVGDPKQSIYGFRSADVYTYLAALNHFGDDRKRTLATNYRSHPRLVNGLNALFEGPAASGLFALPQAKDESQRALPFERVAAGTQLSTPRRESGVHLFLLEGESGRRGKFPTPKMEEERAFPFIAGEIIRLKEEEGLVWSDIAILVDDRFEAERMERYLGKSGIPAASTRGRPAGRSATCKELRVLIEAIAHPSDQGLLKRALGGLIGWEMREIEALDRGEAQGHLQLKLHRLHALFDEGGPPSLIEGLLCTEWRDQAGSLAESILQREGGAQVLEEIYQLAEMVTGSGEPLPYLGDLAALLHRLERERGETRGVLRTGRDEEAVRLLTIHASKGLEFGVVFALGACRRRLERQGELAQLRGEGGIILCPSLTALEEHEQREEEDAEKARLLYVALTRARERVYLPVAIDTTARPLSHGEASPVDLLFAYMEGAASMEERYAAIGGLSREKIVALVHPLRAAGIACHIVEPQERSIAGRRASPELFAPAPAKIARHPQEIVSFTALSCGREGGERPYASPPPRDFLTAERSIHTLPAGAETGILLHNLLERLPKELFCESAPHELLYGFVAAAVKESRFQGWEDILVELLFNTLRIPFPAKTPFRLIDVKPERLVREVDFLFATLGGMRVGSRPLPAGFVKGCIDLLFEHEGRYYALDWKSNWLGTSEESYSQERLQLAASSHDYLLQARLYKEALIRTLARYDDRPFDLCFGGFYLVFLRGAALNAQWGVLEVTWDE